MSLGAIVSPSGTADAGFPQPNLLIIDEGGLRPSTFTLNYDLTLQNGDYELLSNSALDPDSNVVVQVAPDGNQQTLIKGFVLGQSIDFRVGGDGSKLQVLGADQSARMNQDHRCLVWSDVTDSAVAQQICSQNALTPSADSTNTVHSTAKCTLVQRETDLEFLYRLARRNGFWFWLEADASAQMLTAHFARPPVSSPSSATLSVRAGSANVDGISLHWDTDRPSATSANQLDLSSLSLNDGSLDRSPLSGLASNALADVVKNPRTRQLAVPVNDQADLQSRSEALLIEAGWFVTAHVTARLSVLRSVVRANTVVTLDGAGSRHSGTYLVSRVVHTIDADDHVMEIDLVRNGWN
jgi:phage protein D